jgi:hypothetical protein
MEFQQFGTLGTQDGTTDAMLCIEADHGESQGTASPRNGEPGSWVSAALPAIGRSGGLRASRSTIRRQGCE